MSTDINTSNPATTKPIGGLDAIVLITPNLQAQRTFYKDTLGLELVGDYGDAIFFACGDQTLALFGPTHHQQGTDRLDGARKGISHLEFSIPASAKDTWHQHLLSNGGHAYGNNYQDADGNLFHFNLAVDNSDPEPVPPSGR